MSAEVKLNVHEFAEGWALVTFVKPPEDDNERYKWLDRTAHDWLAKRQFTIQEVRPMEYRGKLYGMGVFYLPGKSDPRGQSDPTDKSEFKMEVDKALVEKHGAEYLEAVMADVASFVATTKAKHPIMALTNRRQITTIVERATHKGLVMSLERFRPRLAAETAKKLDEWLASTNPGYFMVPVKEFK